MKESKILVKNALIISISMIIVKIIGAVYRVPLTSILGGEGIGIYQMVFPFYTVLLTLSSTGIPQAISKLIAENRNGKKVLLKSIWLFGSLGLIGSIIMFVFADKIAVVQGSNFATNSYKTLSLSVFLVSIISCFRGYFQGKLNMFPTAISQIIEQLIKLLFGLFFAYFFGNNVYQKTALALLAVTISEFFAFIYIIIRYKKSKEVENVNNQSVSISKIIITVLPVTLSVIMLPLSRVADSFLVVNLLSKSTNDALMLYGIYYGGVESLIGVPVALCYGIAISSIPLISKNKKGSISNKAIIYTFIFSIMAAVGTFAFSKQIVNILYFKLSLNEKIIMSNLLKASSLQVVLLSLLQTTTSVLVGMDKLSIPPRNLLIAIIIKILLALTLIPIPFIGIAGAAISDILCYFVAVVFNLMYINNENNFVEKGINKPFSKLNNLSLR